MKRYLFCLAGLMVWFSAQAQVKTVILSTWGEFEAAISDEGIRVTVSDQGWITHCEMPGKVEYYPSGMFGRGQRIARIGSAAFSYYPLTDALGRGGKLARIGAVEFDYYDRSDAFGRAGRLAKAGEMTFDYYPHNDPFGRRDRGLLAGVLFQRRPNGAQREAATCGRHFIRLFSKSGFLGTRRASFVRSDPFCRKRHRLSNPRINAAAQDGKEKSGVRSGNADKANAGSLSSFGEPGSIRTFEFPNLL